jgi:lipoprotein-anchoring transpeptidase ErfK/SrfK
MAGHPVRRCLPAIAFLIAFATVIQPAAGREYVAPQQQVAVVLTNQTVRTGPNGTAVELLRAHRPITGEQTVLPVLAQHLSHSGHLWLRVRLPGRTFGEPRPPATAWIRADKTLLRTTAWHLVVNIGARQLTVYKNGHPVRDFSAIVGKPSTPTPTGQYFVEEDVRLPSTEPGAPFALATSDRSRVLQEYDGGPGQIAIHGLENLGGQIGTAESHGCVRLTNQDITWLAARAGPGTPVTIRQ